MADLEHQTIAVVAASLSHLASELQQLLDAWAFDPHLISTIAVNEHGNGSAVSDITTPASGTEPVEEALHHLFRVEAELQALYLIREVGEGATGLEGMAAVGQELCLSGTDLTTQGHRIWAATLSATTI